MQVPFLNLAAQKARLGNALRTRIDRVLDHCRFVLGPEIEELETALAAFAGTKYAVSCSSGTDALLMMLMAENIGRGDCVFLPSFTYVATAEVICLLGATPIFVDVNRDTYQIDPVSLRARLNEAKNFDKRVLLGVDLFGQSAPWDELAAIASEHDLILLSDCAQSFGGRYHGRGLGGQALMTGLSFFPSKPLGCYGDGGAILTDDCERAHILKSLRNHGAGEDKYDIKRIGLNGRLDTLQAAVLLSKLETFDYELERREEIARLYDSRLPEILKRPGRVKNTQSAWSVYCVQVPKELRENLMDFLRGCGIAHAVYYPKSLHLQTAYKSAKFTDADLTGLFPNSEHLTDRVLALPIYADLSAAEQNYVIDKINDWAASL